MDKIWKIGCLVLALLVVTSGVFGVASAETATKEESNDDDIDFTGVPVSQHLECLENLALKPMVNGRHSYLPTIGIGISYPKLVYLNLLEV